MHGNCILPGPMHTVALIPCRRQYIFHLVSPPLQIFLFLLVAFTYVALLCVFADISCWFCRYISTSTTVCTRRCYFLTKYNSVNHALDNIQESYFVTLTKQLQFGLWIHHSVYISGFPRLLDSPGFFSWKFQDLESPGKISLKITHFLPRDAL